MFFLQIIIKNTFWCGIDNTENAQGHQIKDTNLMESQGLKGLGPVLKSINIKFGQTDCKVRPLDPFDSLSFGGPLSSKI